MQLRERLFSAWSRRSAGCAAVALVMLSLGMGGTVEATGCGQGLALQVLGSGGPILNQQRASAGYLLWIDGKARVLLETGAGSYSRFGATGANIENLSLIALSHLHVDHATDLSAYIKGGYFTQRTSSLPIAGPSGANGYPGIGEFLQRLFGTNQGAFAYLSGTLDGTAGQFKTAATEISVNDPAAQEVIVEAGVRVAALPVTHGPVPTIAYRFEVGNRVIVYGADQNGDKPEFVQFAKGADLLVMPFAVTEDQSGSVLKLHAKPAEIGTIAHEADAKRLLLSHVMPAVEHQLDESLRQVTSVYRGPVDVAEDLMCVQFDAPPVISR